MYRFVLENASECIEEKQDRVIYTSPYGLATLVDNEAMESHLFRPLSNQNAKAIEVFHASQYIFWLDMQGLNRMKTDGTDKKLLFSDLQNPQKLSIDWVSERIYWTDDKSGVIESSNFHGKLRYVLISKVEKPHAIIVNPLDGLVFWTDLKSPAKIERAGNVIFSEKWKLDLKARKSSISLK